MNNIDYTQLIQAVIALVSVLITTFLVPYLKRKVSAQKLEELKKWVYPYHTLQQSESEGPTPLVG